MQKISKDQEGGLCKKGGLGGGHEGEILRRTNRSKEVLRKGSSGGLERQRRLLQETKRVVLTKRPRRSSLQKTKKVVLAKGCLQEIQRRRKSNKGYDYTTWSYKEYDHTRWS